MARPREVGRVIAARARLGAAGVVLSMLRLRTLARLIGAEARLIVAEVRVMPREVGRVRPRPRALARAAGVVL
jgi:hypothetical protein